jgi:hypothetical protein
MDTDTLRYEYGVEVGFALKARSRGCQLDSDRGGVSEGIEIEQLKRMRSKSSKGFRINPE